MKILRNIRPEASALRNWGCALPVDAVVAALRTYLQSWQSGAHRGPDAMELDVMTQRRRIGATPSPRCIRQHARAKAQAAGDAPGGDCCISSRWYCALRDYGPSAWDGGDPDVTGHRKHMNACANARVENRRNPDQTTTTPRKVGLVASAAIAARPSRPPESAWQPIAIRLAGKHRPS